MAGPIPDYVRDNVAIELEDVMDAPALAERGGILRARAMFGARLPALLEELTEALAAIAEPP